MPFLCRQCGTCCLYLGDYLAIEEQTGPYTYTCCSVSTGTPFLAEIDADKRALFNDRSWIDLHPAACPFLRLRGEQFVCTIHETSPPQCKAYRCVVMRILTMEGNELGIVTGTLMLHSSDPGIRSAWEEGENTFHRMESGAEKRIARFLEKKGYLVVYQ
jgi:Fe-S-cluster containining protein